ncbi:hypothetical protein SCB29_09185 [Paraburkholderia sp. SIMBA_055]|jgi:hypothetical protein
MPLNSKDASLAAGADAVLRAYGIRAGDNIGILKDVQTERLLIETLTEMSCQCIVFDPREHISTLSSMLQAASVRLVLGSVENQSVVRQLRVCFGYADAFLDKANVGQRRRISNKEHHV